LLSGAFTSASEASPRAKQNREPTTPTRRQLRHHPVPPSPQTTHIAPRSHSFLHFFTSSHCRRQYFTLALPTLHSFTSPQATITFSVTPPPPRPNKNPAAIPTLNTAFPLREFHPKNRVFFAFFIFTDLLFSNIIVL